jgi:serine/threonine-protein kinase 11
MIKSTDVITCRYNLVTGRYPFDGDNIFNLFENISKCHYEMPDDISYDLASLLRGIPTRR